MGRGVLLHAVSYVLFDKRMILLFLAGLDLWWVGTFIGFGNHMQYTKKLTTYVPSSFSAFYLFTLYPSRYTALKLCRTVMDSRTPNVSPCSQIVHAI